MSPMPLAHAASHAAQPQLPPLLRSEAFPEDLHDLWDDEAVDAPAHPLLDQATPLLVALLSVAASALTVLA